MTNEEERGFRSIIAECRRPYWKQGVHMVKQLEERRDRLADLAERLLKENSELRVRDSNVTAHSLNVMAVNEDLQAKLWARETEVMAMAWVQHVLSEDFAQEVGNTYNSLLLAHALGRAPSESRVHRAAMLQYQTAIHAAVAAAQKKGVRFTGLENEPHSPCLCAEIQRRDSRRHFKGCPLRLPIVDAELEPTHKWP